MAANPPARTELFGFKPTPAHVEVVPRSGSWRFSRAFLSLAIGWGLIPVVAFVPPHFPWVLAGFFGGIWYFVRFWREHYTLEKLETTCPKCGAPLVQEKPTRLALPQKLHCDNCQQNPLLHVDVAGLEPGAPKTEPSEIPPGGLAGPGEPGLEGPPPGEPPEARPA